MKKINKITMFLMLGVWAMLSASCSDKDNWQPGPELASDNPGVYFDRNNPMVMEIEADQQLNLVQDHFTIMLGRDETKSASALQVPVIVRYAESNLIIPATVNFEAGATTAELNVKVGDYSFGVQYGFTLEIDAKYANPYKKYDAGEDGGSTRFSGKVEAVCLLAEATFTSTDYSGSNKPLFVPFKHKIYDNQDGTFTIKNFLYNNAGYNFIFTIDNDNNFRPIASCGFHSLDDARWYFYLGIGEVAENRIPCYIPGGNPADYITYVYFYTPENTTSYQDFWIDRSTKTGRMMGYARFSLSSSGRIAFNIAW